MLLPRFEASHAYHTRKPVRRALHSSYLPRVIFQVD